MAASAYDVAVQALSDHITLLIDRGGYITVPLLALSVISLALCIERAWFWITTHRPGHLKKLGRLNDLLRSGRHDAAQALIADDRSPYGRVARALLSGGATDAVAIEAVEDVRPRIDRFMTTLSTIVTAAPLLGILGTVVGIIQSFRLLEWQTAVTDTSEVAGGIAAALLTTALGLIVALLTLFPYMIFRSQAGRAIGRLESLIAAAQQGVEQASPANSAAQSAARGHEAYDGSSARREPTGAEEASAGAAAVRSARR